MNIRIRDDEGLGLALMNEGYSSEQRLQAKNTIRSIFGNVARRVFQDVLGMPPAENIIVNMAISEYDEMHDKKNPVIARFLSVQSSNDLFCFSVSEIFVKTVLDHPNDPKTEKIIIHEMFHAADLYMLQCNNRLLKLIIKDIEGERDIFCRNKRYADIALLKTLNLFRHYRAEGVAILGESLLGKSRFRCIYDPIKAFCWVFNNAMIRAQETLAGNSIDNDDSISDMAYNVAQIVMIFVLYKREDISDELLQKVLDGLATGEYDLTDEEVSAIMRPALALSLSEYIQGLISLGDKVAPIRPFLDFCSALQNERDDESISAYENLFRQPESSDAFNSAMNQIMGCCMSEKELDGFVRDFMENGTDDSSSYPQMKEKVQTLYDVLKNDDNPERRQLAKWALTYFFDDEDIIHDDISGIGYVDDMMIIDYALKLLC